MYICRFLNQARASLRPARAWFLDIAFVHEVGVSVYVCVCVSTPEAINYIYVIFNLYNQLNKFVAFRNVIKISMHRCGLCNEARHDRNHRLSM